MKKFADLQQLSKKISMRFWFYLFIALALGIVYSPSLSGGFLWDDDRYLTQNSFVKDPQGLAAIWSTRQKDVNYWPLTHTLFWLQHAFWSLNPLGYRLVNLVLHFFNVVLFGQLLSRLQIKQWRWMALFFAIHPIQVESVAWISELKNTSSSALFLISLYVYCISVHWFTKENQQSKLRLPFYSMAILGFVLSLLAKTSTCVFPAFLLGLHYLYENKISRNALLQIIPFGLIATLMVGVFYLDEQLGQKFQSFDFSITSLQRLLLSCKIIVFYVWHFIWPHPLMVIYPHWPLSGLSWQDGLDVLGVGMLALACVKFYRLRNKEFVIGLILFIVTLAPVLGWVDHMMMPYSYVADHYAYLASFIILPLLIKLLNQLILNLGSGVMKNNALNTSTQGVSESKINPVNLTLAVIWLIFCYLSFDYSKTFVSSLAQWQNTVAKNPQSDFANYILGTVLQENNQCEKAIAAFTMTITINQKFSSAYNNRGTCYMQLYKMDLSLADYNKAISLRNSDEKLYFNRANLFMATEHFQESLHDLNQAIALNPKIARFYFQRGNVYIKINEFQNALQDFNHALAIQPNFAEVYHNRGLLYLLSLENKEDACKDWAYACNLGMCDNYKQAKINQDCP